MLYMAWDIEYRRIIGGLLLYYSIDHPYDIPRVPKTYAPCFVKMNGMLLISKEGPLLIWFCKVERHT